MDHEQVKSLEHALEQAISKSLRKEYAPMPEPPIVHLMAKAAVTVLEAAESANKRH